jgi:hypothetical protein
VTAPAQTTGGGSARFAQVSHTMESIMSKLLLVLVLGLTVAGVVGCHASGHADDSGVGANVSPK